ncbi:MAG: glycosyltransferase family 4 protein [Hormoscilla sp. GM7CHS1pb]|nr:glycosyltransferase family 4 protein [Hormoscilla sp. GM7CHS1pb]
MNDRELIINLSVLMQRPTGVSTYAMNLLPHLKPLSPTLLVSEAIESYNCYQIPAGLTPEQGAIGHLKRLTWTQLQLGIIYQKLKGKLLFSPIPEAPLGAGCRFAVMVHDLIPLRFPEKKSPLLPYFRYYVPQVLAQATQIICNSQATAKDITEFYQIPLDKILPVPLAYDSKNFKFLDLPTGNYFLYVGRSAPYKNLPRLIAAFARIKEKDYQLWLAGTPDRRYTPGLRAFVEELGLTDKVKFLDYVPYSKLPVLMNRAIGLVFPSLWEGFGIPVLEAMACGTPVITSNISSLPEITGDAAILVDPYNVGEITAAMETVVGEAGVRSDLSRASLARASQFSWTKTGLATRELLRLLMDNC